MSEKSKTEIENKKLLEYLKKCGLNEKEINKIILKLKIFKAIVYLSFFIFMISLMPYILLLPHSELLPYDWFYDHFLKITTPSFIIGSIFCLLSLETYSYIYSLDSNETTDIEVLEKIKRLDKEYGMGRKDYIDTKIEKIINNRK